MAKLIAEVDARGAGQAQHAVAVRSMFDRISPTYDLLNRLMSAGIDRSWRRKALQWLEQDLPQGPILDMCAGTLDLAAAMEAHFPDRPLLAADFARDMLVAGRGKVRQAGVAVADAMRLPLLNDSLAGAVCGFGVRNLSDPYIGLQEMARALKPGGNFVVLEFFRPTTPVMAVFHAVYARFVLPTVGWIISRDAEAYGYLARSMRGFYTRTEYEQLARDAGFSRVESIDLTLGIASLVRCVK